MRIVLSPLAARDLVEAHEFVEAGSPRSASKLIARVTETLGLLASGLVTGRQVTLRDGRRVSTWPVHPFRLYYRIQGAELQVVRIYHQARRPIERRARQGR